MAFTFTVEDGSGLAAATSYVSVEEADDIVAVNIHGDARWSALDAETKQKLLSWASRYMDSHTRWFGSRAHADSGLRWPRSGIVDRDGVRIADTEIPKQLRVATASMALYLIDEDRSAERAQDALVRLKADVVELEFDPGYRLPQVPSHMQYLLLGLGSIQGGSIKFGRIVK